MFKNRFIPIALLFSSPFLASCATVMERSTQPVSFKTVGADDAVCDVRIGRNNYRFDVRPPQSIWVQKSKDPMFISCNAPGNRVAETIVESSVAGTTFLNALSGGTSLAVDGASGAMFKYPDEVIIDFSSALAKEMALPSYENRGALNSREQNIENMGPDTPALNGDKANAERYRRAYAEADRLEAEEAAMQVERERRIEEVEGGFLGDKGNNVKKSKNVNIAPISDAMPIPKSNPSTDVLPSVVPDKMPQLGKPIFPSTTTF